MTEKYAPELHPLYFAVKWNQAWREAFDHTETPAVSAGFGVVQLVAYLDANLAYAAQQDELPFADFAREASRCRDHLERVLHDGEQIETGAPCMDCRVPLRRQWAAFEAADGWYCPRCRQESTEDQYHFAVKADYIKNATELNADDMAVRTEVPASTVRRWAHVRRTQRKGEKPVEHPPIIKPTGRINDRKVYAVADVEYVRDNGGEALRDTDNAPAVRRAGSVVA